MLTAKIPLRGEREEGKEKYGTVKKETEKKKNKERDTFI